MHCLCQRSNFALLFFFFRISCYVIVQAGKYVLEKGFSDKKFGFFGNFGTSEMIISYILNEMRVRRINFNFELFKYVHAIAKNCIFFLKIIIAYKIKLKIEKFCDIDAKLLLGCC
uniref:(northern house mosquito) hypothetical protein n=1 Tax=Culex pipiens TaxID=7175 RepID=A0A8D8ARZ7_CULPI